ncbi:ABC transporter substrate-binding protein [Acuticoccus sp. M5D2P5]|uniref:ABC transporter substrate-binding protein n=1 Tax=Acuticoccus kalidii TaxID=2910977 RepID=UPI001F35F7CA|nr:ABC transporter substrate-binding protein [Acuticoccus kalidii]MCF3934896.1 ABC transporter substrate-binding protein [Acuticoccus kalidii]
MAIGRTLTVAVSTLAATTVAFAQSQVTDLPREQTLIVENPEGTIKNASWFNYWSVNAGGRSTGLQQLCMDTLWYVDSDEGLDGAWDNSLAAEPPQYNDDFTEMTVKLREGLTWSDGEPFTADDVLFTVETHKNSNGLYWSAPIQINVEEATAPDPHTVVFKLKKPNSRFHIIFTVRWNALWIMPEHVFADAGDPLKFAFNPPVCLGPYKLMAFDPNGKWFTWEKREDWENTSVARFGEPGPTYVAYTDPGPPDKRVIAQLNHELDIIHDVAPEGMFTLARQSPSSVAWFDGFPYAHPDPTLPSLIFNHQNKVFSDSDVRWALALLIDIKAVSMASYRGAATISAIAIPPTGTHPSDYHKPLESWLEEFELDTGQGTIKPYDTEITLALAEQLRASLGDAIPSDPEAIQAAFGQGWWKPNPEAAAQLLEKAGFEKRGGQWYTPDGEPFRIRIVVEGEKRPVMTRAGTMIAQAWRQFGIDAETEVAEGTLIQRRNTGDFDAIISWSVETLGGHPDLAFFLDSWHSEFIAEPGAPQPPRNWQRYSSPELDEIIEKIRGVGFDTEEAVELGRDYAKLMVREMPIIPLMAYNVFTVMDTTYWTGYPTADNPYTNPVPNWANTKYMMTQLRPTKPD